MLIDVLTISSTIEELNDKLDKLVGGYMGDPIMGLIMFVALLLIGIWTVSFFNSK